MICAITSTFRPRLPTDLLSVTFDALNLHTEGQADPRYGVEVYFNGVLVQTQIVIRPAQLNKAYTTPQFSLASVNAQVGLGFDNIVSVKGINYNNDGGGNWMGIDYVNNPPSPRSRRQCSPGPLASTITAGLLVMVEELTLLFVGNGVINPLPEPNQPGGRSAGGQ
jgi:hypothetical protein